MERSDQEMGLYNEAGFSSPHDEISFLEIANAILRHWQVVVTLPLLLAVALGAWTLRQDRTYAATATFLPQSAGGRGGGGAAALAQQFGVSLGTEQPGQSPQFYVDLLRSRAVLREAVESEYEIPTATGTPRKSTLIDLLDFAEADTSVPAWRRAMEVLKSNMSASVARETGVVQVSVSASHPVLAEQIAARLLDILNVFNTEVRQNRAQEEGRFIDGRLAEALAELSDVESALQEFLRQNRAFENSPELRFEHDRLERQVLMRQEVYTSLLRSQEQARIDAVRDTPMFTVIDHPAGTAEPEGRGTVLRVMLAFMLGLMIAVFFAFILEFKRRSSEAEDPHYQEFLGLARQAWEDLRRPRRWIVRGDESPKAGDG